MLHNRSVAKDCLVSRNPDADFQHDYVDSLRYLRCNAVSKRRKTRIGGRMVE